MPTCHAVEDDFVGDKVLVPVNFCAVGVLDNEAHDGVKIAQAATRRWLSLCNFDWRRSVDWQSFCWRASENFFSARPWSNWLADVDPPVLSPVFPSSDIVRGRCLCKLLCRHRAPSRKRRLCPNRQVLPPQTTLSRTAPKLSPWSTPLIFCK